MSRCSTGRAPCWPAPMVKEPGSSSVASTPASGGVFPGEGGRMLDRVRAEPNRLLILGGTAEAAALARGASERFGDRLEVITALAGRTERPGPLAGKVRIGGFGGVDGLAAYLAEAAIDLLIDATHPFADNI